MPQGADLEAMAQALEASGGYRVLRRLTPRAGRTLPAGATARSGLLVDVETTGLDPARHEIIELAMVPFTYGLDGEIYEVAEPFHGLRQPSHPIPPKAIAIHGVTDEMVAGRSIDPEAVSRFAAGASLVIAHNAAFDRRFLERYCQTFSTKAWGCSMSQIDWAGDGHEGVKLVHLAAGSGFFYEKHRAVHDCMAAIELLARPLRTSGRPALAHLLEEARRPSWRIWAENSPFDLKDVLKARGYRWNGEAGVGPRAWFLDVDEGGRECELTFLRDEIYQGEIELPVRRIDAYDRFSERA